MTSLFNGMAGVLNSVFGAPVDVTNPGGDPVALRGVFRDLPLEITAADGRPEWVMTPTLRLQKDHAAGIVVNAVVVPSIAPSRSFRVLNTIASASPAADAFIIYELEEITP